MWLAKNKSANLKAVVLVSNKEKAKVEAFRMQKSMSKLRSSTRYVSNEMKGWMIVSTKCLLRETMDSQEN